MRRVGMLGRCAGLVGRRCVLRGVLGLLPPGRSRSFCKSTETPDIHKDLRNVLRSSYYVHLRSPHPDNPAEHVEYFLMSRIHRQLVRERDWEFGYAITMIKPDCIAVPFNETSADLYSYALAVSDFFKELPFFKALAKAIIVKLVCARTHIGEYKQTCLKARQSKIHVEPCKESMVLHPTLETIVLIGLIEKNREAMELEEALPQLDREEMERFHTAIAEHEPPIPQFRERNGEFADVLTNAARNYKKIFMPVPPIHFFAMQDELKIRIPDLEIYHPERGFVPYESDIDGVLPVGIRFSRYDATQESGVSKPVAEGDASNKADLEKLIETLETEDANTIEITEDHNTTEKPAASQQSETETQTTIKKEDEKPRKEIILNWDAIQAATEKIMHAK
eukprot:TRINITY_DN4590_c0_g1_i1.p1 TRINITY_DN4590_c0_g1~~TRINITY_DN4590_c0_g1_i1.p1  ORF type:complete len:394 (-),score=52.74 TRINITY_DN4590_c0_g1_i1:6-1187(-)